MVLVAATALVVSAASSAAVLPILRRAGVIDYPVARSSHAAPTPRGGGIAVMIALLVGLGLGWSLGFEVSWKIPIVVLAFGSLGLADDLGGLTVRLRLAIQTLIAAVVGYVMLADADADADRFSMALVPVLAFWLIGYTNVFNFMDGINGISAVSATVAGLWYAYLGNEVAAVEVTVVGMVLAGASLGFLPFNAPKARMFLGDVGSYGLGATVAALAGMALLAGASFSLVIAPLCIYLADTSWTLARRIARGASWREAHRDHVYQRLAAHFGHSGVVSTVTAFTVSCGAVALLLEDSGSGVALTSIAVLVAGYLNLPRLAARCWPRREAFRG